MRDAADPESRDLAAAALAALDVLAELDRLSPRWAGYRTIARRLSTAVAHADPYPPLLVCIQLHHALRDLAEALPAEAPLLLEIADRIHERAWLREHGCVPSCFKARQPADALGP